MKHNACDVYFQKIAVNICERKDSVDTWIFIEV